MIPLPFGRGWRRPPVPLWTRGRLAAAILGLLAAGWFILASPAPAYAHAQLVATTPANGARLAAPPDEIALRFTERVSLVREGIRLLDATGAVRDTGTARVDPEDPTRVRVPVSPDLGEGAYAVSWRVVSADSHPIHGVFVFAVGDADIGSLPTGEVGTGADAGLSAAFWLFRLLGYAGLALLAGGVFFLFACWPAGWTDTRARRLLATGWIASVASALAVFALQGPYAAGLPGTRLADPALLRATLGTDFGHYVVARLAILALLAAVHTRRPAAVALSVALPATWIGTGHANSGAGALAIAAYAVHLIAMTAWLGGLAYLVLCLLRRSAARPVNEVAGAVTRFSTIATGAVVALVATGAYQAWRGVGSLDALSGSAYGRILAFKLAAVGVLLCFGAASRSVVRRRWTAPALEMVSAAPQPSRSARRSARTEHERELRTRHELSMSVRAEVAIAAVVLALTAVLAATPPGSRPEAVGQVATAPAEATATVPLTGGGQVDARLAQSVLTLLVRDPAGAAWDVPEVSATFNLREPELGPLAVTLVRTGPGAYASQDLRLPMPGTWLLKIRVRTTDIDATTVETELTTSP